MKLRQILLCTMAVGISQTGIALAQSGDSYEAVSEAGSEAATASAKLAATVAVAGANTVSVATAVPLSVGGAVAIGSGEISQDMALESLDVTGQPLTITDKTVIAATPDPLPDLSDDQ